ncbi:pyridoxamine 5'-phosphate oxidase family protein [Pseudacidovorax intermedius]|uniref:pyridoxamine 5'-phosphate oxidase family protein n=1 Tax=Pseudacidovorax intermedius TaxID=433924 RepID=UPI00034DA8B9|nr:pyridoxamine 5'-phosphate oxidase family protein [Pseudacidovorax intermedius]
MTFHDGEIALQRQEGVDAQLGALGPRVIRDHMPQQHRDFFAQLPFVVVGSLDERQRPWASLLTGSPGFMQSPDPRRLRIDALPDAADPLAAALRLDAPLGLLGIEPHTRRRNRLNGQVTAVDAAGFELAVGQSFGNCPRYIQAREASPHPVAHTPPPAEALIGLDEPARALIAQADTLFIASAHPHATDPARPAEGVDVSHRGGRPGFVQVAADGTLAVPDFDGNRFFNTLGNLLLNPWAGLLFVDFEGGDLLQLSARAEVLTGTPEALRFEGVDRMLRLQIVSGWRRRGALPLRWGTAQPSPYLEGTGHWLTPAA